jgi:hypothetical protein
LTTESQSLYCHGVGKTAGNTATVERAKPPSSQMPLIHHLPVAGHIFRAAPLFILSFQGALFENNRTPFHL